MADGCVSIDVGERQLLAEFVPLSLSEVAPAQRQGLRRSLHCSAN